MIMIRQVMHARIVLLLALLCVLLSISSAGGESSYRSIQAAKAAAAAALYVREGSPREKRILTADNNDEEKNNVVDTADANSADVDGDSSTKSIKRHLAHDGPECGKDGSGLNQDGEPCARDYVEPESKYVDGYIDYTITGAQLTNGVYPSTTLSCYSSYTKPDGMLICPESRSKFCVKELSTLKQDLCGQSQYFGDQYLDNLCVLRKCASECEEGQYSFQYGGLTYVRNRYCCQENYCNSSSKNWASAAALTVVTLIVSCMILLV